MHRSEKLKELRRLLLCYHALIREGHQAHPLYRRFLLFLATPRVYVSSMLFLTAGVTYLCAGVLVFESGNLLYPLLWLGGFSILMFNVSYVAVVTLIAFLFPDRSIAERPIETIPSTAIVYPIKNENNGLFERMDYTLGNNDHPHVTLCFLSDSDKEFLSYESDVVRRLRQKYGEEKIYYWYRHYPRERKQGNIREWLLHHHAEYEYFLVCDADSLLPKDTVLKLVRKAEHPDNADIAVFQSRLHIAHAKTPFAKYLAISARLAQRLYVRVNQSVFGRSVSFGHGNLIRSRVFVRIKIPQGVLSHDIWDTVYLDKLGYRVAFCYDVITYEEAPSNYLVMRMRDRRWAYGTLQTWRLAFDPDISFATRFYCLYALYMYFSQPVFLGWIILSFFGSSAFMGNLLTFQRYALIGASFVDIELTSMLLGVMLVVFFHKLVLCRTFSDVGELIKEIGFSTLICLNNVLYTTIDLVSLPFRFSSDWVPMQKDPYRHLLLNEAVVHLWPSLVLGVCGVVCGALFSRHWLVTVSPFLVSFLLVIPLSYLTSFPITSVNQKEAL